MVGVLGRMDDGQKQPAFIGAPVPRTGGASAIASASTNPSGCKCCLKRESDGGGGGASGNNVGSGKTRREVLLGIRVALLAGCSSVSEARGEPTDGEPCRECRGTGSISCDLCNGTGFWKALMGKDELLSYKGVPCPSCEGTGEIICTVCLGTGEGNVRGLLRRRNVSPGKGRVLQS